MRKTVGTRSLLSNTIKDTSTIMRNPSLHMHRVIRMIVLVSLIVLLLLRRLLVPTVFRTVHPYISGRMIFTLVHNNSMYMDIHVYYMYMHVYKITLHAEYTAFKWWDHVCTCTYVYMYIYTMYI